MIVIICGDCEAAFAELAPELLDAVPQEHVDILLDHYLNTHKDGRCFPCSGPCAPATEDHSDTAPHASPSPSSSEAYSPA